VEYSELKSQKEQDVLLYYLQNQNFRMAIHKFLLDYGLHLDLNPRGITLSVQDCLFWIAPTASRPGSPSKKCDIAKTCHTTAAEDWASLWTRPQSQEVCC